jgi:hypothetical protein
MTSLLTSRPEERGQSHRRRRPSSLSKKPPKKQRRRPPAMPQRQRSKSKIRRRRARRSTPARPRASRSPAPARQSRSPSTPSPKQPDLFRTSGRKLLRERHERSAGESAGTRRNSRGRGTANGEDAARIAEGSPSFCTRLETTRTNDAALAAHRHVGKIERWYKFLSDEVLAELRRWAESRGGRQ